MMKIGLALSGGGARGVAHVGVIKALEEIGFTFSYLSGTSAGAIVAALYAYGHPPGEILKIIQQLTVFRSFKMAWTWAGLLKMDGMKNVLLKHMPENSFENLKIPLAIAATEIKLGEAHYFTSGELIPAVIASCSIPAVFSPLSFQGGLFVDGGVFENLPSRGIKGKCDFLIGSHCNQIPKDFDPKNMKVMIERTVLMAINASTEASKSLCDVLIEPPALGRYGSFDIAKAQEIFDFAYHYTRETYTTGYFQKHGIHNTRL